MKYLLSIIYIALAFLTSSCTSDSDEVAIAAVNNAPVAIDAAVSVLPGDSISGVLAVSDADNDSLTISIVTGPGNGSINIDDTTTGTYTYAHDGSVNGDSFTFWANDGLLDSNIATITVSTTPPDTPANGLQAVPGDKRITLNWDTVTGAESYNVYWSYTPGAGTTGTKITDITPPFYHDGVANGANYYYVVTAVNTVGESDASIEQSATPIDIVISTLSFTDTNLDMCVSAASPALTVHELTILDCSNKFITSLEGIEALTSLTKLELQSNTIGDISPLSSLTRLSYLDLNSNNIFDVGPLSNLTNLSINLGLGDNNISDVNPLSGLIALTALRIYGNSITDINPLSNLTSLSTLSLNDNNISDLSSLSDLTDMINLFLDDNNISDISPLSGLTNLNALSAQRNNITNINPLSNLLILTTLVLFDNNVNDVSPLSSLTSLTLLNLASNSIGGQGVGNVDALVTIAGASNISLTNNIGMSCSELTTLITALGSPPVNPGVATDGVNCTNP